MSKLYKLKTWYSINEAAARLSAATGGQFTFRDLYQLALDRHLTISWRVEGLRGYQMLPVCHLFCDTDEEVGRDGDREARSGFEGLERQPGSYQMSGIFHLTPEICSTTRQWLVEIADQQTERHINPWDTLLIRDDKYLLWNPLFSNKNISSVQISQHQLGVTQGELDRFEGSLLSMSEISAHVIGVEKVNRYGLSTKDVHTLFRLIAGMARDGYGYNPDLARNEVTSDIESATGVTTKTVKKWVDQAIDAVEKLDKGSTH